jgi:DNA polymerase-3 subunit gamma/tau
VALALYRRHRPATFAELVGQDHVTQPLRTALAAKRINHAYLFSGPRGCGKTSSARILARSLNCVQGPTPDPCGVCSSCVALAPEGPGSIDVVELDAASHGGVDDARELRDRAFYAPAESRYRVFIVDEAHMVTTQGFNALLKIVEEPPEHLVFVFATTEPDKVLPTIRSRTHHYPFRLLPPSVMRKLLEQICAAEGVTVDPAVFPLVVRAGGGSARDSLSVMDQLLAGAGEGGVGYERAVALLGVTDGALLDETVDALAAADGAAVFGAVDRLVEAGHDPRRFATDLLHRLRDLVLLRAVPDAASRGLVDAPADALDRMVAQAQRLGPAALTRYAEIVHAGLIEMRGATAPRLLLELLCARMLLPAASDSDAATLHRLEVMERRLALAPPPSADGDPAPAAAAPSRPARTDRTEQPDRPRSQAPAPPGSRAATATAETLAAPPAASSPPAVTAAPPDPTPDPPVASTPAAPLSTPDEPEPASGAGLDAAAVRRAWPDVVAAIRERNKVTAAMLTGATVAAITGDVLVLHHDVGPMARRIADERNATVITDALRSVLGVAWQVRCEQPGGDPPPSAPPRGGRTRPGSGPAGSAAGGSSRSRTGAPSPSAGSAAPATDRSPDAAGSPDRPGAARTDAADRASVAERPGPRRVSTAARPATGGRPSGRRSAVTDDVPPPPAPIDDGDDDLPPDDEDAMLAEARATDGDPAAVRRDPEEVAFELLSKHLGARRMDTA